MTSPGSIRPATRDDAPALGRLGALLVRTHHDFDAKRFMAPTSRTGEGYGSYLASQVDEGDTLVLVAERDGSVVGYTYAGLEGTDWMSLRGPAGVLHDIVVDPAERGRGTGAALLDATIERLRERGAKQLVLMSAARNEGAHRLFARAGFRVTMVEMTRDL